MTPHTVSPTIPKGLLADDRLSTGARLLWCSMWSSANCGRTLKDVPHSQLYTTKPMMAKQLGVALNTVNRYIRELRALGWLAESDSTSVQTWDLHAKGDAEDPAPDREYHGRAGSPLGAPPAQSEVLHGG